MKFSLGGYRGLDIFAIGHPRSQQIACDSTLPLQPIEATGNPGGSGLTYDPVADQYNYVWKTEKDWQGTCRQLVVIFRDGAIHSAYMRFK